VIVLVHVFDNVQSAGVNVRDGAHIYDQILDGTVAFGLFRFGFETVLSNLFTNVHGIRKVQWSVNADQH
jgi:hypothetical protein